MTRPFGEIQDKIRDRLAATEVPSMAVAVARRGEILWEAGFGWANKSRELRSSTSISYSLGSITKPITATALMILVERGLVDLDRPINDYLGDARIRAHVGSAEDATVRRVATHTAGLPPHYNFFYRDEPWSRPSMDLSILRYGHLVAPPGERFEYSNFGYGLIERLVERVSGVAFDEFVSKEVFEPLAMTGSAIGLAADSAAATAQPYDSTGAPLPFHDSDHRGGSAGFSSTTDLLRFGMFHLGAGAAMPPPVGDDTIASMQATSAETGPGRGYGIGWRTLENHNGFRCVYHDGRMDGVTTRLMLVPAEDVAIVALTNSCNDICSEISDAVLGAVLPGFADAMPRRQARRSGKPGKPSSRARKSLLGTWSGNIHTYAGDVPVELAIKRRRTIQCRVDGQPPDIVRDASVASGRLRGFTRGNIKTDDAGRRPYLLHLDLTLRSRRLRGSITAVSEPGTRFGSALSHWCDLALSPRR